MQRTIAGSTFSEIIYSHPECQLERFVLETPLLVWIDCVAPMTVCVDHVQSRRLAFTRRPRSFDLFDAGEYLNYQARGGATRVLALQMSPTWCGEGTSARYVHSPVPRVGFRDAVLSNLMGLLAQHVRSAEPLGKQFSEILTQGIASHLQGEDRVQDGIRHLRPGLARVIEEWIEHRLDDPPSIAEMAELAGMGMTLFGRAFRRRFDVAPHQYVVARRVERAKKLLRSDDATITDVAISLGFATHAHFSAVFRMRVGVTPMEYRRAPQNGMVMSQPVV